MDYKRPNCPLHHYYDIANLGIYPDMKYQNYATGQITGGLIRKDLAMWLKCKQKKGGGRIAVRSGKGIQGYFSRRKLLGVNFPEAATTPRFVDDETGLLEENNAGRQLLQADLAGVNCNNKGAVNAAVQRVYSDLQGMGNHIGCHKKSGYFACHQMEYSQGRVCGSTANDCVGKNW